jgi:hypothetical protein
MKNLLLITFLSIIISHVYANVIDLECKYDFIRDNQKFNDLLKESANSAVKKERYRKHEWWEFWNSKIIYFSINTNNNKATALFNDLIYFPGESDVFIRPDMFSVTKELDESNKKFKIADFNINRLTGNLFGTIYKFDTKTNDNNEEYSISGICKPIDRKF